MYLDYTVNKKIDYLVFKVNNKAYRDGWSIARVEQWSRLRNYDMMTTYMNGAVVHTRVGDPDRMEYIVMDGTALDNMRETLSGYNLLKVLGLSSPKFNRVDIAVTSHRADMKEHGLTPHDIALLAYAGKADTRLKTDNHVLKPDMRVETAYIGSRKSRNKLFRAYDKGAMLDLERHKIIRYELQANKGAETLVRELVKDIDIGSLMNRYISFPDVQLWRSIVSAKSQKIKAEREPIDMETKRLHENASRWAWLISSCSKTIAKAMVEDAKNLGIEPDNSGNVDEFSRLISLHYREMFREKD